MMLSLLARTLLIVAALLVVYYNLPLEVALDARTGALIVGGLVVVAVVTARQIRAIVRSDRPGFRAAEALALAIPLFIIVFAVTYFVMGEADTAAFTQTMSRTDALYFAVTILSSVGFGDISPVSEAARIAVSIQMISDLIVIALVVHGIVGVAKDALQRKHGGDHPEAERILSK